VIRGELLVIPIEESLIYVQPLYLRAEGGQIPELKRVIVAHESRVVMEQSLEAGLARLFGGGEQLLARRDADTRAPAEPPVDVPADREALQRAVAHYERARAAQRADDWSTYGEEMRLLGELLRQLSATTPAPP